MCDIRARRLNNNQMDNGPVVYWMSRDQRIQENWALLFSQKIARQNNESLFIVFCLVPSFLEATQRQYSFMMSGLQEVENDATALGIPFQLLVGQPDHTIPLFLKRVKAGTLVTDFDPLRVKNQWKQIVKEKIHIALYEVDAHNIIPCWIVSDKQEYNAYLLRKKINALLPDFLTPFPPVQPQQIPFNRQPVQWNELKKKLAVDRTVRDIHWLIPGERASKQQLTHFLSQNIYVYRQYSNKPTHDVQSQLSPYLHFGQLSAQHVALEIMDRKIEDSKSFLEQLIVRRELSDNFCYFNNNYDSYAGLPKWARTTLEDHQLDERTHLYTRDEFEKAKTHDDLWNAAQMEMVKKGKMHGYMRMYWAKKILEWSADPETAIKIAIYFNDKYELDGRDPNGYVGVLWSIGGLHDRPWPERPVFGKIRYMNYSGCKSKFNVKKYIEYVANWNQD